MATRIKPLAKALYEKDFYAWSKEQAELLRTGRFGIHWSEIDEDIELAGLLLGAKAPDAKPPVEA